MFHLTDLGSEDDEEFEDTMGLLKDIFKKSVVQQQAPKEVSGKCIELLEWEKWFARLQNTDHYISRKEYMAEIGRFSDIMQFSERWKKVMFWKIIAIKMDIRRKRSNRYVQILRILLLW